MKTDREEIFLDEQWCSAWFCHVGATWFESRPGIFQSVSALSLCMHGLVPRTSHNPKNITVTKTVPWNCPSGCVCVCLRVCVFAWLFSMVVFRLTGNMRN